MTLLIMLVAPIVNSLLKVNVLVIVEVVQTFMIAMISSNFLFFIFFILCNRPPTVPLAYSQPKGEDLARFARYRTRPAASSNQAFL